MMLRDMFLRTVVLTMLLAAYAGAAFAQEPSNNQTKPALDAEDSGKSPEDAHTTPLSAEAPFDGVLDLPPSSTLEEQSALSTTPKSTLREQGFVFSDSAQSTTSRTAALIALTAGIPLHGIGHLWVDDTRTSTALFIAEGASLLLMSGAALASYADEGATSLTGVAAPVFQLGFSGFVVSYLLDVVGTLRGTEFLLPTNFLNRPGLYAAISYGFVTQSDTASRHLIRGEAGIDFDVGHASVQTTQNVLLGAADYKATLGARLFRVRRQTFLTLDAVGDYYQFSETGSFDRLGIEGRLGGSLDLGAFFGQFNDVAVGMWFGLGRHYYTFGEGLDSSTDFVSHRAFFNLNLTDKLNMSLGHGSHPASDVPSLTRLFGVTDLEFVYGTRFGFLRFKTELGDGAAFWLGGDVRF